MSESTTEDLQQKLKHYEQFLDNVLKPELKVAEEECQAANQQVVEYMELEKQLKAVAVGLEPYETEVDLGFQAVFCDAIAETESIFVHVGMGFHVELTVMEAKQFVAKRIEFLKDQVLRRKQKKLQQVKNHVQSANMILKELKNEIQG